MSITHEHARKLIQLSLDQRLYADELSMLSAHLQNCSACRAYQSEIKEVTHLLVPLMRKQWNIQPVPLSIQTLTDRNEKIRLNTILTMRTALVSFFAMALFFSVWQFVLSSPNMSQTSLLISPVPTPSIFSAPSASTLSTRISCETSSYTVQEHDTLASIARQFSVSEDTLMELNQLATDAVRPTMKLTIPLCRFTPTVTIHPATFTTTYTPNLNDTPSTPNG